MWRHSWVNLKNFVIPPYSIHSCVIGRGMVQIHQETWELLSKIKWYLSKDHGVLASTWVHGRPDSVTRLADASERQDKTDQLQQLHACTWLSIRHPHHRPHALASAAAFKLSPEKNTSSIRWKSNNRGCKLSTATTIYYGQVVCTLSDAGPFIKQMQTCCVSKQALLTSFPGLPTSMTLKYLEI